MRISKFIMLFNRGLTCMIAMTAIAASSAEANNNTLSIDASGAIRYCNGPLDCKKIVPTGDLKKAIEGGYERLSVVDIYKDGGQEIAATSGGADQCSKFFSFDRVARKFSILKFSSRDICNYKVVGDSLISSYKLDAKQYEDVYKIKNGAYQLALSDGCIGCDEISRSVYKDGRLSEKFLVTNQQSYMQRSPVITTVVTDKAWLYKDHSDSSVTKMYLVKEDKVQLVEFDSSDGLWYLVKYLPKERGAILKWVKCEDLVVCK